MKSAFPNITKINYEGANSKNPLAFKHYNPDEIVAGKTMREHLRFAVVYWHTFRGTGSDPFGAGTMLRPWDDGSNTVGNAQNRVRAAFEFIEKLGAPYYAWHDRDVAPEGKTNNWLQTVPGKGWWTILRHYNPLQPFFDKSWRPSEIEAVSTNP